jgi:hypothetical protein
MKKMLQCLVGCFLFCLMNLSLVAELPQSKEAVILENPSSAEVILEAKGVYFSEKKYGFFKKRDVKKIGVSKASLDAKRAAVYYLLFNGSDPLIATPEESDRFRAISEMVFSDATINELVNNSGSQPKQVISLNKGEGIKVVLDVTVNVAYLRQLLEDNLVIFSKEELTRELGYPFVMVMPRAANNQDAIESLRTDKQAQHMAGVIESFLTSKQYDVIIPEQTDLTKSVANTLFQVDSKGSSATMLAMSIGADVYLDFNVSTSKGNYGTDQVAVVIRAYESTTGRLLGTETAYSKQRVGSEFVSIEEAAQSALANVNERILSYWEDDINKGAQYKLLVSLKSQSWSDEKQEEVIEDLLNALHKVSERMKENTSSDEFLDITLWASTENYFSARDVYSAIRSEFSKSQKKLDTRLVFQNRKILAIEIE